VIVESLRPAVCFLLLVCGTLTGCAQSPPAPVQGWLRAHGGVLADSRQPRAVWALMSLPLAQAGQTLRIAVVDSDKLGAFAWPSGEIFITRALIDLLDDDELAAAVAHKTGHLLSDGHLARPLALDGCASDADAETAADLLASELLQTAGLPQDALPRLLRKVADDPRTVGSCRDDLTRRISRLTSRF
jgi:predicted Zn-dependent protease